jgi:hypothetical protein
LAILKRQNLPSENKANGAKRKLKGHSKKHNSISKNSFVQVGGVSPKRRIRVYVANKC